jgi:hypothetical protein
MANWFCETAAVGLLLVTQAHAQGRTATHGTPSRPLELSEAFPWDEPVEQTFSVDSVLRWRRSTAGEHTLVRAIRNHER